MTDANHENMSLFIVLGGALRLEDFCFAILTLLALWLWDVAVDVREREHLRDKLTDPQPRGEGQDGRSQTFNVNSTPF